MSNVLSIGGVFKDEHWIESNDAVKIALAFAGLSVIISSIHILRHLKNYSMPQVQLYVIRILLTCPVYAITSSLALSLGRHGIFAEVVRDVYEAVVVYSFMHLILEYCGGETDCVYLMENEPRLRLPFPLCCTKPRARTLRLLRFCQRGVLLFILTQPTVSATSVILLFTGYYYNPAWQITQTIIYNISYIWALYCLYVFYLAIKQNIKNFRPIAKFATVKSIIFATYYQSLFLKFALSEVHLADMWNNLLLCIEMVGFASVLMFAFPVSEFQGGIPDRRVLDNVKDVFTVKDIWHDVYHNFTPAYGDYALQRSQSETPASSVGRARSQFNSSSQRSVDSHSSEHSLAIPSGVPESGMKGPSNSDRGPGRLNGKLGSVAQELTERYRGRSRRMAFNSLLRGTQPIRATLRSSRRGHSEEADEVEMSVGFLSSQTGLDTQSTNGTQESPCATEDDVVEVVFDQPGIKSTITDEATMNPVITGLHLDAKKIGAASAEPIGRLSLSLRKGQKSPTGPGAGVQQQSLTSASLHSIVHNSMHKKVHFAATITHTQSSHSLMDSTGVRNADLSPLPCGADITDANETAEREITVCSTHNSSPVDVTAMGTASAEGESCEWGDFV